MIKQAFHWFITDKHGKVALWQTPNLPLSSWLVLKVVSLLLGVSSLRSGIEALSTAFLFTWAYLEIAEGASPFRRALGVVAILFVIIGFFR